MAVFSRGTAVSLASVGSRPKSTSLSISLSALEKDETWSLIITTTGVHCAEEKRSPKSTSFPISLINTDTESGRNETTVPSDDDDAAAAVPPALKAHQ